LFCFLKKDAAEHEQKAVRLKKASSQKKNFLLSETTLLERAARLEQVSAQENNILARHTVQMHTLVNKLRLHHRLSATTAMLS